MVIYLKDGAPSNLKISLAQDNKLFTSISLDPQFILHDQSDNRLRLPKGQYVVVCEIRLVSGTIRNPTIYLDLGKGFAEDSSSRIFGKMLSKTQWVFSFYCKSRAVCLRFDPTDVIASFTIPWLAVLPKRELDALQAANSAKAGARGLLGTINSVLAANSNTSKGAAKPALADLASVFDLDAVARMLEVGDAPEVRAESDEALRHFAGDFANRSYTAFDGRFYHEYAGLAEDPLGDIATKIRSIAFYLPQMHPIPENDKWWGRGFTEWNNVSKGVPRFLGHYQPRLPGELGFYDLRVEEVMARQVELARIYGLYGFCFYYYWFSGKRLLERPLDRFLGDKSLALDFCVCWANENWTRRWDGLENDILIKQDHSPDDMAAVFDDLTRYILDDRYIRIDGKPLILIYRPDLIPDVKAMIEVWRDKARTLGLPGLHLIAANAFDMKDPTEFGMDGLYQFPPHNVVVPHVDPDLRWFDPAHTSHALSYPAAVDFAIDHLAELDETPTFPGAMVGWDTEARKPGRGEVMVGATPMAFRRWLQAIFARLTAEPNPDKRIVFINAWNEWAEGAHLEPDRRHGYAFLTALRSVVREFGLDSSKLIATCAAHNTRHPKTSDHVVVLHIFYFDLLDEIADYIEALGSRLPVDVVVTVPETWSVPQLDRLIARLRPRLVFVTRNLGRDVWPFLEAGRAIADEGYTYACKIHSKKSTHRIDGDRWRNDLLDGLLGPGAIAQLHDFFEREDAGVAAPAQSFLSLSNTDYVAGNFEHFNALRQMLHIDPERVGEFIAGTMFWFRFDALRPIIEMKLGEPDFGYDLGQVDGTLAHAFERLFCLFAEDRGRYNVKLRSDFSFSIKEKNAVR